MTNPKKILVAMDFSECSFAALDHACDLAKQYGSKLYLLHVITSTGAGATQEQDQIRRGLERLGAALSPKEELALATSKNALVGASPQRLIVDHAQEHEIDLIVMGTHGRRGLAHFALGSVAERVLRSAPCPVMVLHPGDALATSMDDGVQAISRRFGSSVEGSRDDALKTVHEFLITELSISNSTADRILNGLEQRGRIHWKSNGAGAGQLVIRPDGGLADSSDVPTVDYSDSPALELVHRAQTLRATDIHVDPKLHGEYSVRFRIDGKLEHYCVLSSDVAAHLINRFKTMSRLDIADPFTPQESRLTLPETMGDLEVRITTAPVAGGEAVALRMFALDHVFLPMDQMGFAEESLRSVDAMLRRGEGLVLVTGPTGAGKSTTVYSMLQSLTASERNIVSIEDPVEFTTPFIRQMNVDTKHGITMASGIRTMLRMDPDVIFVGEIRDAEAAMIAMQAASSGRYVLSTLHSRDVASTITTLRDLGIGDRSLAGNMTGIINQRLVRRLCSECRKESEVSDDERAKFEACSIDVPEKLSRRIGCDACRKTGYRGRIGIFESALFTPALASAVANGEPEHQIREVLAGSVTGLVADALHKAAAGLTDIDEALSVHWL